MSRLTRSRVRRLWCGAAVIAVAGATTAVLAQEPPTAAHDHNAAAPVAANGCGMMAQHKESIAATAAAEQKLAELVARMNAATGAAKVDAIAAVVAEIAAQRTPMKKMQGSMMKEAPPQPATTATEADHKGHHPGK